MRKQEKPVVGWSAKARNRFEVKKSDKPPLAVIFAMFMIC